MVGIKYKVNETFFDKWNPEMAYVLGYWYADGSMYISERGSYLNVTSVDKEIIYNVKKWLKSEHTIREAKPIWPNGKTRFVLRIGNKNLYKALIKLGLYPSKSLTVKFPNVPNRFLGHFVRGYFDGDGCVFLEMSKGITRGKIIRRLSVIFTSGSPIFLEELCKILGSTLELKQTKVYNGHRSYQLRYFTADSIKLFKFMYGDCHKNAYLTRKLNYFGKYFKLRPQRLDTEIENILNKHGAVAK